MRGNANCAPKNRSMLLGTTQQARLKIAAYFRGQRSRSALLPNYKIVSMRHCVCEGDREREGVCVCVSVGHDITKLIEN